MSDGGFGSALKRCTHFDKISDLTTVTLTISVRFLFDQTFINFSHLVKISGPFIIQISDTCAEKVTPKIQTVYC
jgi:hypothetical protein